MFLLLGLSAAGVAAQTIAPGAIPQTAVSVRDAVVQPIAALVTTQPAQPPARTSSPIAASIERWNSLRQTDGLPFSSYASFLVSHRGWPGEAAMRRTAEGSLSRGGGSSGDVLRFFEIFPPLTAGGHAQHALALDAAGRRDEARDAARRAWTAGVMPQTDEQRLLSTFGGAFGPDEHERRMEVLLGNGDTQSAARALTWAPPARRALYEARLALQTRASDAAAKVALLDAAAMADPGLVIDRANWLRNTGQSAAARQMIASARLAGPPVNPQRWLEISLVLARGAVADRQWSTAYEIAAKAESVYPAGTDVSERPFAERDAYTDLTWLGGRAALERLNRARDAARLFDLYGRAARSPQTRAKGFYWAARSASSAGQTERANEWLELAAQSPDQYYGLLALERLGRVPQAPAPAAATDPAERAAFARRALPEAIRHLGMTGRRADQTTFIRALAASLDNDRDRLLASEFGRAVGRPDIGVWVGREARSRGDSFYSRATFPDVTIPPAYRTHWAAAHGIMRQESSFDRAAVSSAGARGMMQLMPGTAQIEARRVGVPYNLGRLTDDPEYNVLLGSAHLNMLMDRFGGNLVLVSVAYNAGPGRVPQWISANGDPRLPGADVVRWIEDIPFSETRNYVQRVVENTMAYDLMSPGGSRSGGRVSYYLGQRTLR